MKTDAETEYQTAKVFRELCFLGNGSYLYPAVTLWTPDQTQRALDVMAAPDGQAEGTRFMDRLRVQLDGQPSEIYRLIAEAMILYYLFPGVDIIRKDTKIQRVSDVLEWGGIHADYDHLQHTFAAGIGGVGTHYLSAQPYVVGFFLRYATIGKATGVDFRSVSACQALADQIRSSFKHVSEARHALLHLWFPDDYESIVSDGNRALLLARYGEYATQDGDDDAKLAQIRTHLTNDLGRPFSFYDPEIRDQWKTLPKPDAPAQQQPADPIPAAAQILLPYLQLTADGEVHKESDLLVPLAEHFVLTEADIERRMGPGSERVFANRVRWAKVNLQQARLVEIPDPGFVKITSRGLELLAEEPHELSRSALKRYPEYVNWLNGVSESAEAGSLHAGNVWIEKTTVTGRPDRTSGPHAIGKALWSPQRGDSNRDIYRFMRDVQPGDIVLHLTDNKGFSGISLVQSAADDSFFGIAGTQWEGKPAYRIQLENYKALEPSLSRKTFFDSPYRDRLLDLRRSGQRNLFYTEDLELLQGSYLTPAPPDLVSILNDAYTDVAGKPLVETPIAEPLPTPPSFTFDDLVRTTHWDEARLNELLDALSADRFHKQIILVGPPGTGKTWVAQHVVKHLCGADRSRWRLVQFHPSYSYEQFVEGLRPVSVGGTIEFRPTDGLVLEAVRRANRSSDSHFLIIDEMNRANLPRVLGELLYLFEYRNESIDLPYTRDFSLPGNLFFIGTMNTADRSIRGIDAAIRRRFEIFECPPDRKVLERFYDSGNTNQVADLYEGFDKLNEVLAAEIDRHHRIGHTFFLDKVFSPQTLRAVWRRKIYPLLEEYFFDRPDQLGSFTLEKFWPSMG